LTIDSALLLGAVAYDPKVITIWTGFRRWFERNGFQMDFVLFSNYERQVESLIGGDLHLAWNSPLAWVRTRRLAAAKGVAVEPIAMRDTDRDLTSIIVVRGDSAIRSLSELAGCVVATGAIDSPQSSLLPLHLLRDAGLNPGSDVQIVRSEIGVGMHGDQIEGERAAVRLLMAGTVDAACIIDSNHLLFAREGILPPGSSRILAETEPYDHCVLTAGPTASARQIQRCTELLLSMDYGDPEIRPLLDLEGLTAWLPGRRSGFDQLENAVNAAAFYDERGEVVSADYRP
jgi:phosphonate transport system substrate-binding protein